MRRLQPPSAIGDGLPHSQERARITGCRHSVEASAVPDFWNPSLAKRALKEYGVETIVLDRVLMADPCWSHKMLALWQENQVRPCIDSYILALPERVRAHDVRPEAFNVYVERRDPATGEVVCAREHHDDAVALPSRGFVPVRRAYVSDGLGNFLEEGSHVTLTLPEERLTKRIDGAMTRGSSARASSA